jgi:uncharacterized protein YaiI (UPF0178 family)
LTTILVDADACPVKEEVYRVARRYGLKVVLVANKPLRRPADDSIELVRVEGQFNAADDWIAGRAGAGDIVVTADIPLAARCVAAGARVLAPDGRVYTPDNIGGALATRDLMTQLRDTGAITGGGPPPFSKKDRSRFLQRLDEAIKALQRGK